MCDRLKKSVPPSRDYTNRQNDLRRIHVVFSTRTGFCCDLPPRGGVCRETSQSSANAFALAAGWNHRIDVTMATASMPSCAILVLNWNGIPHLQHLLPSLRAAVARVRDPVPVVVVDNRSTEPDVEWVRSEFPDVEVVVAPRNDYLFSLNAVVEARREDILVILNNDMRVDPGFLEPLLRHFRDPDVFAASANVYDWEGTRTTTSQRLMQVRHGWLYQWWEAHPSVATHTLYAGGGCAAFRRSQYLALGGFDSLYRPAYFEDVDLSYRAWMRGWRTIYEPESIIYHRIGATLWTPDRDARMQRLLLRNQALCTVKNVAGWRHALLFIAVLPVRAARMHWRGEHAAASGLLASIGRLPLALMRRAKLPRPLMSPTQIAASLTSAVPPENNAAARVALGRLPRAGATATV